MGVSLASAAVGVSMASAAATSHLRIPNMGVSLALAAAASQLLIAAEGSGRCRPGLVARVNPKSQCYKECMVECKTA